MKIAQDIPLVLEEGGTVLHISLDVSRWEIGVGVESSYPNGDTADTDELYLVIGLLLILLPISVFISHSSSAAKIKIEDQEVEFTPQSTKILTEMVLQVDETPICPEIELLHWTLPLRNWILYHLSFPDCLLEPSEKTRGKKMDSIRSLLGIEM